VFEMLKERSFYQRTLRILLPVAAQQLISIGISTMDSIMIGSFSEVHIAATSLANQIMTLFFFMFMGLGTGSSTLAAQFWGAKDEKSLRSVCAMTLKIAVCFGICYSLLSLLVPGFLMRLFTNDAQIIEKGISYYRIIGWCFPFHALTTASTYLLRSTGHTKTPLLSSICAFFINIFFNYMFIFGKFGAPRLEVAGAAVGTLIARLFEFTVICGYLFFKDKNLGFRIKHFGLRSKDILKRFVSFSLPVMCSDTLLAIGLMAQGAIMGHMSAEIVAARSIVFVVSQFVTIFNGGLGTASGVVIGNTIGEHKPDRAYKEGIAFIVLALAIGAVAMAVVAIIFPPFVNLYNVAEATKDVARELFLCMVITLPLQSLAYVTSKGILRGAGDTKFISVFDIILLWVVSLPLGALTGLVLGWRPFWFYFFLTIEFPAKGILCTIRFLSGKAIKDVTLREEK